MKLIRMLARLRRAVYGNVGMGVLVVAAGLIQFNQLLMGAGIAWIIVSTFVLVLTFTVDRGLAEMVVLGEIAPAQRPGLPDVRAHAAHIPDLAKVT